MTNIFNNIPQPEVTEIDMKDWEQYATTIPMLLEQDTDPLPLDSRFSELGVNPFHK